MKPKQTLTAAVMIALVLATSRCGKDEGPTQTPPPPVVTDIDTIPPGTIGDLVAKFPSPYAVFLVWAAPGDDDDRGTAASYDIRYHLEEIDETNWDAAQRFVWDTPPKPAGNPETVRVTSLDPVTTYYFAIKATDDESNTSGVSNCAYSTTLQEVTPPGFVADLEAVAVGEHDIRLTWTAPGDDGDEGTASQYDVRYAEIPITPENWESALSVSASLTPGPAGEPESLLVSGFNSATNYYFALRTADEVPNWSGLSNVAFALGYSVYLTISQENVEIGDEINIIYRAPGAQTISILLNQYAATNCDPGVPWTKDMILPDVNQPAGIYEITYDFSTSPGQYLPAATYWVTLCWSYNMKATKTVLLTVPE